jgi:hypothetical protein
VSQSAGTGGTMLAPSGWPNRVVSYTFVLATDDHPPLRLVA